MQYYPLFDFYAKALQAGESFLWTPDIYSGFPIYLSQVGGFFDPLNILLGKLFLAPLMVELRLIIDILLTFVCAYAAARAMGVSRLAAALVGPSYLLALEWGYLSNPIIANSLFIFPLLLFCFAKFVQHSPRRWRYILLGGLGLGWAFLGGYTQVVFYAVVLALLYAGCYALLSRFALREWGGLLAGFVLLISIGGVVGLPQLLPAYKFLPYTSRADTTSYQNLTLKVIEPGDLVLSVVPPNFYVPYITPGRKPLFVGALWLLLGLGALGALRARRARGQEVGERHVAAIGVVFLFAFMAAFEHSPLYWLLNKLPVFDLFRFPFRFMFLGAFALSLLGAFGFDRAAVLRESRLFRVAVWVVGLSSALFVAAIASVQLLGARGATWLSVQLAWVFNATIQGHAGFSKDAAAYAHAFDQGLQAYRELLSFIDLSVLLPLLCLVASILVAFLFIRRYLSVERFQQLAGGLGVATMVAVGVGGWSAFVPSSFYGTADPFVSQLQSGYRVYPFLVGEAATPFIPPQYKLSLTEARAVQELASAGEAPNLNLIHGVASVDGYDQFEPKNILNAMSKVGGELAAGYGAGTDDERRVRLLGNLPQLGLMSGRYIIAGSPLRSAQLHLLSTSSVTSYGMMLYLYEYPKAYPIIYLAAANCTQCVPKAEATPSSIGNGYYDFALLLQNPAVLVVSESNLPGWRATLDGQSAPLSLVNGLYLGVQIPQGSHTVHLEYQGILGELSVLRELYLVKP